MKLSMRGTAFMLKCESLAVPGLDCLLPQVHLMEGEVEKLRPKIASLMQQWAGRAGEQQESLTIHIGDPTLLTPRVLEPQYVGPAASRVYREEGSSTLAGQLQAPQGNAPLPLDGSPQRSGLSSSLKGEFHWLGPAAERATEPA